MNRFITTMLAVSLLTSAFAASGLAQFPSRSQFDERYAPQTLRGLKALNVRGEAYTFISAEALKSDLTHDEVKGRAEALLKKAGIAYLAEKGIAAAPEAPVLKVRVVATQREGGSYTLAAEAALLQKVTVEGGARLSITATTWSTSAVLLMTGDDPRELILQSVDELVFEFIKAYMAGNSKPAPRLNKFVNVVNPHEPTESEPRPKNLRWGPQHKGLQMAAWPSPVRPVVFLAIRNASWRTIHYCDYLLGYHEVVRLYARRKGEAEWVRVPLKPDSYRAYVGVLLCGPHDSLGPGREMPPGASSITAGAPEVKRKYTFTEHLTAYDFPEHWAGKVECKITQSLFGGRHKDAWQGEVESPAFEISLPLSGT